MEGNYLDPTPIIDSDNPLIISHTKQALEGVPREPVAMAVKIYYTVRDGIWYDPYSPFHLPEHYQASRVLERGRGYCVSKASLLCAMGRVCGIPTRIGFATVRNHLATRQLIDHLGSDRFVFHGFTEFFLEGKWIRATPAFNIELCRRHKVPPLDFNGREDSMFQAYNAEQQKFMEYLDYSGTFPDIPVDAIVAGWKDAYGAERVQAWMDAWEKNGDIRGRDFYKEDII